ncbi:MAG: cupin domain-containing protein [Alphaproteobacteria bacterium]|nr:cupin domain-containing protein [Alphaproteobacteria bacterium]
MDRKPAAIFTDAEAQGSAQAFTQRLNPGSAFRIFRLGLRSGLRRTGVSVVWLAPGKESFAYHAHHAEEEWLFILEGAAICTIDGIETRLETGDFVGFPVPSVPHLLKNPFETACKYLVGGSRPDMDIIDYPALGKSYVIHGDEGATDFQELAPPIRPFGPAES